MLIFAHAHAICKKEAILNLFYQFDSFFFIHCLMVVSLSPHCHWGDLLYT